MFYCKPGEILTITPTGTSLTYDMLEFHMDAQEQLLFDALPIAISFLSSPPNFYQLSSLLKNIYYLYHSADRYRMEKMDLHIRDLLYSTASGDEEPDNTSRKGIIYSRIRRLQTVISDDPSAYSSIREAAAFVGLGISQFQSLYKKYANISFLNDLIRARILRACLLLRSTDWTIGRISKELGYENETYFYRQFKQNVGISPGAYRKQDAITIGVRYYSDEY